MSIPVTQHFTVSEFDCRDGTPYPVGNIDADGRTWLESRLKPLCDTLEVIRAAAGNVPMTIDSGYRTLAYDDKLYKAHVATSGDDGLVASASGSQHPQGRAADVMHSRLDSAELFSLILQLYSDGKLPYLGGLGKYPGFCHIDVRQRSNGGKHLAVWGGKRPSNIA